MVEKVVYSIVNANLVKDPGSTGRTDVMDLQELYDHLERHRLEVQADTGVPRAFGESGSPNVT